MWLGGPSSPFSAKGGITNERRAMSYRSLPKIHSPSVTSNLALHSNSLHHCPSKGSRASPHNAATTEKKSGHNSFVSRILISKFFRPSDLGKISC